MSESHRGLVGSSTVNWDEVFHGLADAKYTLDRLASWGKAGKFGFRSPSNELAWNVLYSPALRVVYRTSQSEKEVWLLPELGLGNRVLSFLLPAAGNIR